MTAVGASDLEAKLLRDDAFGCGCTYELRPKTHQCMAVVALLGALAVADQSSPVGRA